MALDDFSEPERYSYTARLPDAATGSQSLQGLHKSALDLFWYAGLTRCPEI